MKKSVKRVLLTATAVTSIASGTAFAGTIGCFEFTKGAAGAPTYVATTGRLAAYVGADCTGITNVPVNIAYELTKALTLDLADIVGDASAKMEDIVYIPTTDIPSGTLITMKLTGATWKEGGTLVLLKDATATTLASVASSDGATTGVDTITFVTKAGVTVSAGTRLLLSSSDPLSASYVYTTPKVYINNTTCPGASTAVTLEVVTARTDGGTGYSISGGKTAATTLVDISQQFGEFTTAPAATVANVDVETASLRTKFVNNILTGAGLLDKATDYVVPYADTFTDNGPNLDQAVIIAATDLLNIKFVSDIALSSTTFMKMKMFDVGTSGGATADTFAGVISDTVTASMSIGTAPTTYSIPATQVYHTKDGGSIVEADVAGKLVNTVFFNLTNTDPAAVKTVTMDYNYKVTPFATLTFPAGRAPSAISHCEVSKQSHAIGINGAVIKVPYIIADSQTFIRISNEDTSSALIFGDFEEAGMTCKNISFSNVGNNASVIIKGDAIMSAMAASANAGCSTLAAAVNPTTGTTASRFFGTFTVTAPANKVHAYGIQKIVGGTDRVLTILDQNQWNQ